MRPLLMPPFLPPAPPVPERQPPPPETAGRSFENELHSAINRSPEPDHPSGSSRRDARTKPAKDEPDSSRLDAQAAPDAGPPAEAPEPTPAPDAPADQEVGASTPESPDAPVVEATGGGDNGAKQQQPAAGPGAPVTEGAAVTTLFLDQVAAVVVTPDSPEPQTTDAGVMNELVSVTAAATGASVPVTAGSAKTAAPNATLPASPITPADSDAAPAPAPTPASTLPPEANDGSGAKRGGQTNGENTASQPQPSRPEPVSERADEPTKRTDPQTPPPSPTRVEMVGRAVSRDEPSGGERRIEAKIIEATDRSSEPSGVVAPAPASTGHDNLAAEVAKALLAVHTGAGGEEKSTDTKDGAAPPLSGTPQSEGAVAVGAAEPPPAPVAARPGGVTTATADQTPTVVGLDALTGDPNVDEITRIVSANVGTRNAQVRLQLDPPSLGQMQIDVRVQQDVMALRIAVDTNAALVRIQSTVSHLKHALETHGLVVDRVEVQLRGNESASARTDHGDEQAPRFADGQPGFGQERSATDSSARDGRDPVAASATDAVFESTESREAAAARSVLTAASVDLLA